MKVFLNRKGFAYIMTAVFLAGLLFTVFYFENEYSYRDRQALHQKRIVFMNDFVKGFQQDIDRAVQIASVRALISLEDFVATNGEFLNSTEYYFKEAVQNGTIEGTPVELMNDSNLNSYLEKTRAITSEIGINMTANITNITLSQSNPWNVTVTLDILISITDAGNTAYWNYSLISISEVPIYNLRDPLYSHYTYNRLSNTIRPSNYSNPFVNETNNDTANLIAHAEGGYYIESNLSPNFIMRFENNISPNEYGIESIVDLADLSDQDISVYLDRIKIDYIYFNNLYNDTQEYKVCNITNIPDNLYLIITTNRISKYNISNLGYLNGTACP
ncbi:MAG: hypothetical protein ACP5N3_01885 [Candidatus Nanoarchaeia archaeon]